MDADDIKVLLDLDYIEYVTYDAELQVTSSDVSLETIGSYKLKQAYPPWTGQGSPSRFRLRDQPTPRHRRKPHLSVHGFHGGNGPVNTQPTGARNV